MDLIKNGVNKNITFYRKINFELLYIYILSRTNFKNKHIP